MKNYGTLNPWGHVSKADRVYRGYLQRLMAAQGKILQMDDGKELLEEARVLVHKAHNNGGAEALSEEEGKRFNEICDRFNEAGIRDSQIEILLEEPPPEPSAPSSADQEGGDEVGTPDGGGGQA